MPNLLRKKRLSSSGTLDETVDHTDENPPLEQHNNQLAPPSPSPSSSKTAFSRRSISFSMSRRKSSDSSSSIEKHKQKPDAGSKLSPMKSIAKKAKQQIQRIEDAVNHVTSPIRRPEHGRAESEGTLQPAKAKPSLLHFPTFSSPSRRRTTSTTKGDSKKPFLIGADGDGDCETRKVVRNRTISLPIILRRARSSDTMTSGESSSIPPLATSLQPVEEEVKSPVSKEAVRDDDGPDPFLVDEEGDALSDEDHDSEPRQSVLPTVTQNVPLSVPESPSPLSHKSLPSPNVNKDVPPPPAPVSDEEDEEDDVPDLYLPGLVTPTIFLPIPNNDPLTNLLNKYVYPPENRPHRDVSGEWQHSDFHTLVMTNSWRALARMARDRIVGSDPADVNLILGLWHLRLSCLARLRLFNQTVVECTNLFTVLNNVQPPEARAYIFDRLLPFELEVMQTRLKYWAGDHMGYIDALAALLRKCKISARKGASIRDVTTSEMWKERGSRVALMMASQMVEMKEFIAAARLLEPLCTNAAMRSAIARIYLQCGNLTVASAHFRQVEEDSTADERQKLMNSAVLLSAQGDWAKATEVLKDLLKRDSEDYVAVNNLAVALLNQGKLKAGIEVLETALKSSPSSVVVAEPFLFNLSTLYELRSNIGFAKKRELLVEVAKWSGDGLRTTCLKLPPN